jgi:hypothetical protein
MLMVADPVAVWTGDAVSVTVKVAPNVPPLVGVPVIAPVAELMASPGGRLLAEYVLVPAPPAEVTLPE